MYESCDVVGEKNKSLMSPGEIAQGMHGFMSK